jgi:hypothetical protein
MNREDEHVGVRVEIHILGMQFNNSETTLLEEDHFSHSFHLINMFKTYSVYMC